jgi:23S rRNA pseudouridine1911/1915/1917 synthase
MNIVYQDNHLIAINKPNGQLVQVDQTGDISLEMEVKEYIRVTFNKPGEAFLGVIHRIDRPVSGLVLMARTSKALERMNLAFKERKIQKTYYAIVRNQPPQQEGRLVHWLTKDSNKNLARAYDKETKDSLRSELTYKLIAENNGFYLLEVKPITGRTHQIRIQLSKMGCPIVGDNKYGYPRANKDRSICLHSRSLEFEHPVTKEQMKIVAEVPGDAFWQKIVTGD